MASSYGMGSHNDMPNHGLPNAMVNAIGNPMPNNGQPDAAPKANQACLTCRKQKRKCDKGLPSCSLCHRMSRHCDYSDSTPQPTAEDYQALKREMAELKSFMQAGNANAMLSPSIAYAHSAGTAEAIAQQAQGYVAPPDYIWEGIQNRFPAIVFLDSNASREGGIAVPKAPIDIPNDVLDQIGNGTSLQEILDTYFVTVHRWMPIVSRYRIAINMANENWVWGPDTALLFLCMKLVCSRPEDGVESFQNHTYMAAKRFLSLVEASGTVSLLALQSAVLVFWYEYGQAIYPAAYLTAGWCKRYGTLLGINVHAATYEILGPSSSWVEQEERVRTWWGVLLADRIVRLGSQGHNSNSLEPVSLPANDTAWEHGDDTKAAVGANLGDDVNLSVGPFARLCQVYSLLGKIFNHHDNALNYSETDRLAQISLFYEEIRALMAKILDEKTENNDFLELATPLALTISTLFAHSKPYFYPTLSNVPVSEDTSDVKVQAAACLKFASASVIDFVNEIQKAAPTDHELDKVSPIVMDSLYSAASHNAFLVRETGDQESQETLEKIRRSLDKLRFRWRNGAEYLRIIDGQEFQYAVRAGA